MDALHNVLFNAKIDDISKVELNNARIEFEALKDALLEIDRAIISGDLIWRRKRQSDNDPYHPANVKLTRALTFLENTC